jgi:hypothetical protein
VAIGAAVKGTSSGLRLRWSISRRTFRQLSFATRAPYYVSTDAHSP